MAHHLLYSTTDTLDYRSEENFPWLGPAFGSSNSFIPDMELFYDVELVRGPSLEEIIASWGPEAPALVDSGLPAPLADAYGSGPTVEPVTSHCFDQSTDPDICLADPMAYPMMEIGSFELYGPFDPVDQVSNFS